MAQIDMAEQQSLSRQYDYEFNVEQVENYQIQMMINNRIAGLMPVTVSWLDQRCRFRYRSVGESLEKWAVHVSESVFEAQLSQLVQKINQGQNYLLLPANYVMSPEQIYIQDDKIQLIYLPLIARSEEEWHRQNTDFLEFICRYYQTTQNSSYFYYFVRLLNDYKTKEISGQIVEYIAQREKIG